MVHIDLLVFAPEDQAQSLLRSFADMASGNILEPEDETAGYQAPVLLPGMGSFPAHRGVAWEDMDSEEALDAWVESNADTLPFLVVMRYSHPANPDTPLLAWRGVPGCKPHTVGDIQLADIQQRMRPPEELPFLEASVPLVLTHEEMQPLRACMDELLLDSATPAAPGTRPGPRI